MGKKISWEDAERLGVPKNKSESIYAPQNKYGYKININHPNIRPLYDKFKRSIGAIILSDTERLRFEALITGMIERRQLKNERN